MTKNTDTLIYSRQTKLIQRHAYRVRPAP